MSMVFHVGIYQSSTDGLLYVSAYDSVAKTTNILSILEVINEEIFNVFKNTKNAIEGELGNLCIYLEQKFDDTDRKSFIETGLKNGFKAVEFLSPSANKYLQAIFKADHFPKDDEIIWIYDPEGCYIWQICDSKAKLQVWLPFNGSHWKDLRRMESIFKNRAPNAIIYVYKVDVSKDQIKEYYPNCQNYFCDSDPIMDIPLMKARMINNAVVDGMFDVVNVLDRKIQILYSDKTIMEFCEFEHLPCEKSVKVVKLEGKDEFILQQLNSKSQNHEAEILQKITLPNFNRFLFHTAFDVNGIVSINFKELPELSNANAEVEILHSQFLGKANDELSPLKIDKEYRFLSNGFINDFSINAIGISFGATVNRKNGIEVVALDNKGQRLLPSYVGFDEGQDKCGQIVIDRLWHHAESSVFDLKQIIGQKYDSSFSNQHWPFHLIPIEDSETRIQLQSNNRKVAKQPEEVLAVIFRLIKQKTEEFQGKPLSEVVITVPQKFNENQRNATFIAASLAEWKAVHLLPEPIAAVFAYFFEKPPTQKNTVLVFDLGGGTLDLCILEINDGKVVTISSNENKEINGKIFDNILAEYFETKLFELCNVIINDDNRHKLMKECQTIKESLSVSEEAFLEVDKFDASFDTFIPITRTIFESLCTETLNKITHHINSTLLGTNNPEIDKILYVGGGSRMPMIQNLLKSRFPSLEHCIHQNPEEVTAIGAAYYAFYLNSSTRRLMSMPLRNEAYYHWLRWFQQNPDKFTEMFQRR